MDAAHPAIDIRDSFGSAYIGAMIMMILYGITCLQTYMYFVRYHSDSASTKLLVSLIWAFDTFHVILVSHCMYHYLVLNYANPLGLTDGIWSLYISVGMNVLIATVVQCFFTHKLHDLSGRNRWLTGTISFFVLAHFVFGMETMAELFVKKQLSRISEITIIAAMPLAITAVLSDVLIAGALCILLHNKRTAFRSTNLLLDYLIIYAINRCLLTSVVAIVEVIIFAVMPHSFWFLAVDFVIGKCYANSLLATLNTRKALRGKATDTEADPDGSSVGVTHGSLDIAAVTPSMINRSGIRSQQSEIVSLTFDPSQSRTYGGSQTKASAISSTELKEFKSMSSQLDGDARQRLSAISAEKEESSSELHDEGREFRTL